MAAEVTLEEVWRLFKATDEKLDRSIEEADRRYAAILQLFAESRAEFDRRQAEVEERQAEADRRQAEADRRQAEADRRQAETDVALQKMARSIDRLAEQVGYVTGRLGEFAEAMVVPMIKTVLAERGIEVQKVRRNVPADFGDKTTEFDALLEDGDYVVAAEIKSRLKTDDVRAHLERMADFKAYFPEYQDRIGIGLVAGLVVDDEAARYAYRKGLFVLRIVDGSVTILNDAKFKPMEW